MNLMPPIELPKIDFRNARIVGVRVNPTVHHAQTHPRGHREFMMSRGELMRFNECPIKWLSSVQEDKTTRMSWGDLIDCLLFVPEQLSSRFAFCPETYPSKDGNRPWNFNAEFCRQWRDDRPHLTIIKSNEALDSEQALAQLHKLPEWAVLKLSHFQVSLTGEYCDVETELCIPIRALVDIAPGEGEYENSLIDLKTTSSAEPRAWARRVSSDHLDAQAAIYLDLFNAASGDFVRSDFRHIIQESEPPFHVELRILSQEFLELGRLKYRSALKKYCRCLATNTWPGYDNGHHMTFGRWGLCEPEAYMVQNL